MSVGKVFLVVALTQLSQALFSNSCQAVFVCSEHIGWSGRGHSRLVATLCQLFPCEKCQIPWLDDASQQTSNLEVLTQSTGQTRVTGANHPLVLCQKGWLNATSGIDVECKAWLASLCHSLPSLSRWGDPKGVLTTMSFPSAMAKHIFPSGEKPTDLI
jgi:hypothetical protein